MEPALKLHSVYRQTMILKHLTRYEMWSNSGKIKVSPIHERLGVSDNRVLSETVLPGSPVLELLPDVGPELLVEVTSEPPLWTSSTSRFVLAMELTNRNRLCGVGEEVFCLNLWWVPLVISSIAFAIASAKDEGTWSTEMPAVAYSVHSRYLNMRFYYM
jgi:hypothetical protein